MKGLPLTALLAGLVALAGCSTTGLDRYGRRADTPTYGRSGTYNYPVYAKTGSGSNERYRVCHRDRNTLTLPAPAVRAHIGHGDYFGNCGRQSRDRHDRWSRGDHRDDSRREARRGRDRDDDRREARRGRDRDDDDRGRRRGRGRGRGNN